MAKKQKTNLETLDVYQAALTPSDIAKMRSTLAKRANQRLVRLERATSKITGESYKEIGAYPIAQQYLSRKGRKRFQESLNSKLSYDEQRIEILNIQRFLRSKTSLVSGIRAIERKRIETFQSGEWGSQKWTGKERRKIQFSSTKEFYDFFSSSVFKELVSDGFTSEQVVEAYDTALETYEGKSEEALARLAEALSHFREQGKITLKELREYAGSKALT